MADTALQLTTQNATVRLPALITWAGQQAARRFYLYFTASIHNLNTRAAYTRAARDFLCWCEAELGLVELYQVQPLHVAAYIEVLMAKRSASTVKQHLAGVRMLFNQLINCQLVPCNPAHAVRKLRRSGTPTVPQRVNCEAHATCP